LPRKEVRDRFDARFEPERLSVRSLWLRNKRQRRPSEMSDVSVNQLESNAIRTGSRGAEMNTAEKIRDEESTDQEAQKKLTTSVGTPLVKPEKTGKRKLFGRRREQSGAGS
jgi:hypothetical protein